MVVVDLEGNQVSGGKRKATSEVKPPPASSIAEPPRQSTPSCTSIPPHATAFAVARRELPKCVLPEIELFLGEIPAGALRHDRHLGVRPHPRPVDRRTHDAFLLTNHGAVTVGLDPFDAYYKMETLDQYCRILLLAAPGSATGATASTIPGESRELLRLKEKLGIPDPRRGSDICEAGATPNPPKPRPYPNRFLPHPGPITDQPKLAGSLTGSRRANTSAHCQQRSTPAQHRRRSPQTHETVKQWVVNRDWRVVGGEWRMVNRES
jgi:L-fuculose-phosphate aldolase